MHLQIAVFPFPNPNIPSIQMILKVKRYLVSSEIRCTKQFNSSKRKAVSADTSVFRKDKPIVNKKGLEMGTIQEDIRQIPIYQESDVVVVGGGPAGIGAAVAAARNGAKTTLLERYGHLGGMATGGLVMVIMPMSDGTIEQQIGGLCQEMIDRLDVMGAAIHPKKNELGSSESGLINYWKRYAFSVVEGKVRMAATVDPEALKCVLNDMVSEAGINLLLHSWGTQTIMEGNQIKGVIFESKSGRQAVLGKIVIDATGDGDIFASAGASFDSRINPEMRSSNLALTFRLGNIDSRRYFAFKDQYPQKYTELMHELEKQGGFTLIITTTHEGVFWVNNNIPGLNPLNVADLTWLEVNGRRRILLTQNFLKKHIPGFERCFILDTASQIGVRSSRRLIGQHILTEKEIFSGTVFPDTIAICPDFRHAVSSEHPHWHIPFRSLVASDIKNLLVAGRCYSSDLVANDLLAPIQSCIAMGQASGTAAALATQKKVTIRDLDFQALRNCLVKQGVPLP